MLFQKRFHAGLADGSITLSFRSWSRPQVKVGGRYRVGTIGLIEVRALERVSLATIRDRDARAAGFADRNELLDTMRGKRATKLRESDEVFRVRLRYAGTDDRPGPPSHDAKLDADTLHDITRRLERMDAASQHGVWTREILDLIAKHPRVAASKLAPRLGRETQPFKADVRKLKRLGLTLSHEIGYELSPRGHAFLKKARRRKR